MSRPNEALFWRRAASLSKLFDYVNLSVRELKTNYIYIACVLSLGLNLHFCDGTASHARGVICRAHNGGFVLPARVLCVLCSRRHPEHLSGSAPPPPRQRLFLHLSANVCRLGSHSEPNNDEATTETEVRINLRIPISCWPRMIRSIVWEFLTKKKIHFTLILDY